MSPRLALVNEVGCVGEKGLIWSETREIVDIFVPTASTEIFQPYM